MKTNELGLQLIKYYEGFRSKAYKAVPSEKYYTIGYGHYGADVKSGMVISKEQGEKYLKQDLEKAEKAVDALGLDLNENEFSALVSFTYNCGACNLKKLANGRSIGEIGYALKLYNKAGGKVLEGLVRRRKAEEDLFFKPCSQANLRMELVSALQRFLNDQIGAGLKVDGICGAKTREATEKFYARIGVTIKWQ